MALFVVFLFGLAVGSFLNAFIYRMEKGESALRGRSYCPQCRRILSWHDLIPLLSFVLLQGRCRYCKGKISLQYPFVELAAGLLFVATFSIIAGNLTSLSFPQALHILYLWVLVSAFVVIFVYDLKHFIIPDKVLYPAIGLVLLWRTLEHFQIVENLTRLSFLQVLLAGLGAAGFFLAIYLLSKGRAMGFGDVKLAFLMGVFLGFPSIVVALLLAFGLGAVVGLVLIILKKKTMHSQVPFGPFLVLGTLTALFWGRPLVDFYLDIVGV